MVAVGAKRDSLLLSSTQSGDKVVERYLVRNAESGVTQFEMMFPINNSTLQSTFADNADAIAALNSFAKSAADTTMHITSMEVVGYASPDGQETKNKALAAARAKAMESAAANPNGAMMGFMGMGMAGGAMGGGFNQAQNFYQMGVQQQQAQQPAPATNSWKCACGAVATGKFCPECGEKLPNKKFCTECGAELGENAKFCSECGAKL